MAQTIKLKRSNTAGNLPTTTDLALGEVAINTKDGKFFIRKHVDGTDSGDAITMYAPQGLNTYGTQVLEVKVITKTAAHPQYGTGSASGYSIDGLESPFITLIPGNTYKFDQADSSNTGHPLAFYLEEDKTTSYTTGVTSSGTPGSASAYTQIVVSTSTPQVLYYQCSSHAYMGSGAYALSDAIANGKVGTDQLAANAVTSAKIAKNAVSTTQIAKNAVGTSEIASNAITSALIAGDAVGTDEIADNAITTAKIAANSVGISELNVSDGTSGQALTTNGSGTLSFSDVSSTLAGATDSNISSPTSGQILVYDGTNSWDNVSISGDATLSNTGALTIAANAIEATMIAKNAVGSSEIAANAVGSSEIASDAVGTAEIADNAVTAAKIAKNAVGTSEIAANSVGISELNVSDGTNGQVLTTNGSGTLSFTTVSSSSQNLFETIAVAGQSDIVADSSTDTLTFAAGSGISLTTNASTDTLTITATGGGLSANAVTSAYIASNAVLARHIAANSIGPSELAATAVSAGSYTNADITVDAQGRITAASSGSATIADNSITSAKIAANAVGSSELAASGVTAGTYGSSTASPQLTVDKDGRITSVSNVTISSSGGGGGVGLNQTVSQYSASGDGSTLAFNTSITLTDENLTWVFIDGVYQQKNVYSVSGTTVTFGSGNAPPNGSTVEVMVLESITTGGAFGHNSFNGDGSTATFTLGQTPTAETDLIAFIDGVYQNQDSFTLSGSDITFDTAPANGTKVIVYVIGGVVTGKVQIVNNFSGDASTTAFTLTINPVSEENTNVYIDGVYQQKSEYSVSGTTLTFSSAPPIGTNNIEVVIGQVTTTTSMGANSVTSAAIAASAVGTSELAANAVTTAKIASNSVTSAKIAANAVGSSEIAANAVTATQLGSNAVTSAHIAIGAVGAAEIAANAVSSSELASDALSGQNFTGDVTFDTNVLFIDSVNNEVGIGTTNPASTLHVDATGGGVIRVTRLGTSASAYGRLEHDGTNTSLTSSADLIFNSNGAYAGRFDSSGNLLVGKASSAINTDGVELLNSGRLFLTTTSLAHVIRRKTTDGALIEFQKDTADVGSIGTTSGLYLGSNTGGDAYIRMGYSAIVPATSTGANRDNAIDLGYASSRFKDLYLSGSVKVPYASKGIEYSATAFITPENNVSGAEVSTPGVFIVKTGSTPAERMRIDSSGNVGIGTSVPGERLEVKAGTSYVGHSGSAIKLTNAGYRSGELTSFTEGSYLTHYFENYTGGNGRPYDRVLEIVCKGSPDGTYGESVIKFMGNPITNGSSVSEIMRINGSGKVGIGTSSPAYNLTVGTVGTTANSYIQIGTTTTGAGNLFFGDTSGTGAGSYSGYIQYDHNVDAMILGTVSTERMRIDTSGNVGIGINPSGYGKLTVSGTGVLAALRASSGAGTLGFYEGGAGRFYIRSLNGSDGIAFIDGDSTTERMRIDSSGRVGIGTEAPDETLHIERNTVAGGTNYIFMRKTDQGAGQGIFIGMAANSNDLQIYNAANNNIVFKNQNPAQERMRIDTSGNLLVGTTSSTLSGTDDGFVFHQDGNSSFVTGTGIMYMRRTSSNGTHIKFRSTTNATVGQIDSDGSNTSYVTSSDYRLKENVTYDFDALTRVQQLKPARFNFIANPDITQDGFIAHEVQDIVPIAVSGIKDAVDEEGNIEPQGVDHSKLVPLLTKAIQEQQTIIEDLKARIETLESN